MTSQLSDDEILAYLEERPELLTLVLEPIQLRALLQI